MTWAYDMQISEAGILTMADVREGGSRRVFRLRLIDAGERFAVFQDGRRRRIYRYDSVADVLYVHDALGTFGALGSCRTDGHSPRQRVAHTPDDGGFVEFAALPSPGAVTDVLRAALPRMRACYHSFLLTSPELPYDVVSIQLDAAQDGTTRVMNTGGTSVAIVACALDAIRDQDLPVMPAGTAQRETFVFFP